MVTHVNDVKEGNISCLSSCSLKPWAFMSSVELWTHWGSNKDRLKKDDKNIIFPFHIDILSDLGTFCMRHSLVKSLIFKYILYFIPYSCWGTSFHQGFIVFWNERATWKEVTDQLLLYPHYSEMSWLNPITIIQG